MLYEPDALVLIELQAEGGEVAVAEESGLRTVPGFSQRCEIQNVQVDSLSHLGQRLAYDTVPAFPVDLG